MTRELEAVSGAVEAELRAGLEGVTPGPWRQCGGMTAAYRAVHSPSGYIVFGFADASKHIELGRPIQAPGWDEQDRNARHIARCSPENIATILNALATLRADNERLGRERDEARARIKELDDAGRQIANMLGSIGDQLEAAGAERDTLLAQVEKMREALEEIATRDVHPYIQIGDDPNECGPTIMIDGQYAKIARAALTKEPS